MPALLRQPDRRSLSSFMKARHCSRKRNWIDRFLYVGVVTRSQRLQSVFVADMGRQSGWPRNFSGIFFLRVFPQSLKPRC